MMRSSPGVDIQPILRPLTRMRNLTSECATLRVKVASAPDASRSAAVGAVAVYNSLQKIKAKVRRVAAHMLEADAEDIVFEQGKAFVKGSPESAS